MPNNVITIPPAPPELEAFFKKYFYLPFVAFFLFLFLSSLFYSVGPEEDAVVLRFGKYNRTEGPGLHVKIPSLPPFISTETVTKVAVRKIHKLEIGYRTVQAGVRSEFDKSDKYQKESLILTGDLNVANVEWTVQYQISNAKDYLFNVRRVATNLNDISLAVMREVIGDKTITEVLTTGRLDIQNEALDMMQKILNNYNMGVKLVSLNLQDVDPPEPVKPSFNDVNSAKQESEQVTNEAWKEYNKVIPEARGKAEKTLADAQAYKQDVVNHALGDSKRFLNFYEEYKKAPDVTKRRLYFEKMRDVLQKAKAVYIIDPEIKNVVPLLNTADLNAVTSSERSQ